MMPRAARAIAWTGGFAIGMGLGCDNKTSPAARDREVEPDVVDAPGASAPSAAPAKATPPCPTDAALVENVCVDRWEAHLVVLGDSAREHSPYERPRIGARYAARSSAAVVPQAYVNRLEAAEACANAGKRLCRAAEWRRACVGSRNLTFPYGHLEVPDRCNTGKAHLPVKVFGPKTTLTYDDHYNNPKLNQEPGFLAKTGAYADCVSEAGVHDMVGNLHEWVADDVSNALSRRIPIPYGKHLVGGRGSGVFMGGYFSSKREHGRGCSYVTTNHKPDYHDYSIGFRCCRDAR